MNPTLPLVGAALLYIGVAPAQPPEAVLRFDEARREELADVALPAAAVDSLATVRPFAFKLNRRRVGEAAAYDAVTLWNVRKVRAKNRCMRLSDTTRREKVRLLKFFTVRNRRKGVRPHLLGNVAGYSWSEGYFDPKRRRFVEQPRHIARYTLRPELDSIRRAGGEVDLFRIPDSLWHELSPRATYILDGERVPAKLFQFIDGLTLRTLEIRTDSASKALYDAPHGVVLGDTYPDRVPLVVLNGKISSIDEWLRLCRADAFSGESEVPIQYFYMLPLEAVETYGLRGKYGAICIYFTE